MYNIYIYIYLNIHYCQKSEKKNFLGLKLGQG